MRISDWSSDVCSSDLALTMRLGGGGPQRADQAHARARVAQAQYDGTREKAVRDAAIAWSDVDALEQEVAALRVNYISSRQSRDVLAERFRVSRGTRSEERRAGRECVSTCSFRWAASS